MYAISMINKLYIDRDMDMDVDIDTDIETDGYSEGVIWFAVPLKATK